MRSDTPIILFKTAINRNSEAKELLSNFFWLFCNGSLFPSQDFVFNSHQFWNLCLQKQELINRYFIHLVFSHKRLENLFQLSYHQQGCNLFSSPVYKWLLWVMVVFLAWKWNIILLNRDMQNEVSTYPSFWCLWASFLRMFILFYGTTR